MRVALSTENPPQIHSISSVQTYGIAERRLAITIALQNEICTQGGT